MITSMINSRIRHVLLLQEKSRARSKEGLFVTEGVRMFEEVPEEVLKEIYCSESFYLSLTEKKDDNPHRERVYQKPIVPSEQELAENSRAKSSKLRVFEKADV